MSPVSTAKDGSDLTAADFVHLHNHTHYSLLDGLTKIPDLVDFVKEQGMEAVAVTDHGTMSGLVELYKTANDAGIKPILGCEAYVAARSRLDKDPSRDKERFHITLLAKNNQGYENLCRMISIAETEGKYYKPRIDHETMEKYHEGVICLSGCASSEISVHLKDGDYEGAKKLVDWYHSIFGDDFYLEMQDHGHPNSPTHWPVQTKINEGLQKIAQETDLPLVITCDGHYLKHEDQDSHEVLLCVGTASNLSDPTRMSLKDFQLHVIPPAEIIERWGAEFPEAIRNTKRIAEMCDVDLQLGRILIPKFPVPEGEDEKTYLHKLVFRGLVFRYAKHPAENVKPDTAAKDAKSAESAEPAEDKNAKTERGYTEAESENLSIDECRALLSEEVLKRIDYELSVVDKMGYNGYFLIVQDFINWGKRQGIVYGPGRGSAAGALLAYALRITELDPLKYDLIFERFLNPDRISMPDIDTDIQDTRRDEVIEYCSRKYGAGRVTNICTFGKMMGKMAVRDVARVLEVPYAESDRIAKLVPDPVMGHHVPLKKAIVESPDLKAEYESNPTAKEIIDIATTLEGTIRSHGVHACGVVIAPDDLVKFLPVEVSAKGPIATQYPSTQVEELGLLKMDFLGLSNLSVINDALRMIKKVYGEDVDMYSVPLDDPETFALFQRADTTGVFQLESAGMKRYLRDLKATHFEDIIAMVALYRPGPMQFIDQFIRRKNGQEPITYLHSGLENALKSTYGIMIYQEQFMQISREWCGFTGGESDTLRKAVGKKKVALMNELKPKFIKGAVEIGGATEEIAETFWNQLLEFANYCFNKSHAACYGLVAYWTAYLKAHYPDAFMAALMTSENGNTDRLAIEISECKRMGMKVLGPDVNESFGDFGIVKGQNTIRFGLSGIKSMGKALIEEEVIPERKRGGPFKSVCDFARRVNSTKFNKRSWEAAIKTGAFDSFAGELEKDVIEASGSSNSAKLVFDPSNISSDLSGRVRADLLFNLDQIQGYGTKVQKDKVNGQTDIFSLLGAAGEVPEPEIKHAPMPMPEKEMLLAERDLMGLYLSAHPLDKYDTFFAEQTHDFSTVCAENDNKMVTIGGIITGVRSILTKSQAKMAFVKIESKTAEQEVVVFPSVFEEHGAKLEQDNVVKITGRVNATDRDGRITTDVKVLAESVEVVSDELLANYQPTGTKLPAPAAAPARGGKGKGGYKSSGSRVYHGGDDRGSGSSYGGSGHGGSGSGSAYASDEPRAPITPPVNHRNERLYCLLKKPNDTNVLMEIKHLCDLHPGIQEIILVIKENGEKRPIRMPFRVEATEDLTSPLKTLLGDDCVVVQ